MLKTIVEKIHTELVSNGVENVYTCFDNIPISSKGSGIFTVVGVEEIESSAPIFSQYTIFLPFKAVASISLIAPKNFTMAQIYQYWDDNIIPLIRNISSLTCGIKSISIKPDSNINKLTLKVKLSVSGNHQMTRSGL